MIIINVENSHAAQYFCGNIIHLIYFRIHRLIESSKEQRLSDIEIFCSIMNIYNVTFDHFNASFMNKRTDFLQKILLKQCLDHLKTVDSGLKSLL